MIPTGYDGSRGGKTEFSIPIWLIAQAILPRIRTCPVSVIGTAIVIQSTDRTPAPEPTFAATLVFWFSVNQELKLGHGTRPRQSPIAAGL